GWTDPGAAVFVDGVADLPSVFEVDCLCEGARALCEVVVTAGEVGSVDGPRGMCDLGERGLDWRWSERNHPDRGEEHGHGCDSWDNQASVPAGSAVVADPLSVCLFYALEVRRRGVGRREHGT